MTIPPTSAGSSDLSVGAFRADGPWLVDPAKLTWLDGTDELRAQVRAEVPRLIRRRRVPPLWRFLLTGARLLSAIARWAIGDRRRGQDRSRSGLSRRLRRAFERLGPTYIKLGQIISSGEGLFPDEVVAEFKLCRDKVPAEPFDVIRRVVSEELGVPLEDVFSSFNREPIAAASIAQVHAATLRSGEEVVVKVQRARVSELVRSDIAAMSWIAPFLVGRIPVAALANPPALVELFAETILEELDFRLEAQNMLDIASILAETNERAIVVPRPHPTLVTRRLLVMEKLEGFALDDVEGMRAAGIDTTAVLRAGVVSFLEGAMLYGVFHGDLHGGNLFVMDDGRIALLDYGITGRLDERGRIAFLRLLVSGTTNDVRGQLEALRDLGALPVDTDITTALHDLGLDKPPADVTAMSPEELVKELRDLIAKLLAYGARMPKVLMLFVKNMVFLDGAISLLAPDLDLFAEVTVIFGHFASKHGERIAADIGTDPSQLDLDIEGFKAVVGVESGSLSYRDLQERRKLISRRLSGRDLL